MKRTKNIFFALILLNLIFLPMTAGAVNSNNANSSSTLNQTTTQAKTTLMERLEQRANSEIDRRINALNKLLVKIDGLKKLNTNQKSDLKTQISSNVSDLTNLKSKIAADTDITTMRQDTKSITDSYRIFAIFMPKIHLLSSLEVENNMSLKLTTLATKIETKLGELKTAGKDTSELETYLADMKAQIKTANELISGTENSVISIDPSGYPDNRTNLISAKNAVIEIKKSLITSRTDAVKIIAGIKRLDAETTINSNEAGKTNTGNQTTTNEADNGQTSSTSTNN